MSSRFVGIVSMAAIALAATLTANAAQAERLKVSTTVIVKCDYLRGPEFETRVAGVEVAGPRAPRIAEGMSCAEAFNMLNSARFELVNSTRGSTSSDAVVDVHDYQVWRRP